MQPFVRVGIAGWITLPILIIGTAVTLVESMIQPFMKLTAVYLHHYSYTIITAVEAMAEDEYYIFSIMIGLFCVIMPSLKLISICVVWGGYWEVD